MKLRPLLTELFNKAITEKMIVKKLNSSAYAKIVAAAYDDAPVNDPEASAAYSALNSSNHTLFQRLLSRIDIIFTTEGEPPSDTISVAGKDYKLIQHNDPYETADQMTADVKKNKKLMISIDYSNHPYFSVEDNIIFRSVHDYIVHILGKKPFGLYGELQAYNLHAKLVPPAARAAIFTEVVGQVCWQQVHGDFPAQKAAVLHGFDYIRVGDVSQETIDKYGKPETNEHYKRSS